MSSETVYLYTLSKESETTIKGFKGKQSDPDLKSELERFINHFETYPSPDVEAAGRGFTERWEEIKSAAWASVVGDFGTCKVSLEENQALKQDFPAANDDVVFHLDHSEEVETLLRGGLTGGDQSAGAEKKFSVDGEIWLWHDNRAAKGRIHACCCERHKKWSVSFRRTEKKTRGADDDGVRPCFLNTPKTISELLWKTISELGDFEEHGLVVITGRTGSCKSQIAKALIEERLKDGPFMHLVTYEDPIERPFSTPGHRTAREKGKDVSDLEEALRSALRQKPAAFFVGETRDPKEWELLLNYAGTGHLAVTTAHAGSLIEAMGNVLQATEADDPTTRSVVGERLLAVIHLKSESEMIKDDDGTKVGILIPAIWRRTPEGIKALMSEGLSSVVPNTPPRLSDASRKDEPFPSSVGRFWFARELLERTEAKITDKARVENLALEWDLEGV